MNGIGSGAAGDVEQQIAAQVRFSGGRGTESIRLCSFKDMGRGAIRVRIDGDGSDAEFAAGARNAQSDLSTIGDEDFFEGTRLRVREQKLF